MNKEAVKIWEEKIDVLERDLALASDSSLRFSIRKNIEEAKKEIARLSNEKVLLEDISVQIHNVNSKYLFFFTKDWVCYVVCFLLVTFIGLFPYFDGLSITLFIFFHVLIPVGVRDFLVPISSIFMGLISIIVQWYGANYFTNGDLKKCFLRILYVFLISAFVFCIFHVIFVTKVDVDTEIGVIPVSFITGVSSPNESVCIGLSTGECIKKVGLDPTKIMSLWSNLEIRLVSICLVVPYILLSASLAGLISIFFLKVQIGVRGQNVG